MIKSGLMGVICLLALKLSAPAYGTELVSANKEGTDAGILPSTVQSISGDGRYVVFVSRAPDLVAQFGFAGTLNVFVRDLLLHTNRLVSVNRFNSAAGDGDSHDAVISRNGRFVAFVSGANDLVLNDSNEQEDVFVRDLLLGTTRMISINRLATSGGNGPSGSPSISADGRLIAFTSDASDLVTFPLDNNQTTDVFVRDTQTGTTTMLSVNKLGSNSANGRSAHPVISQNGARVAFTSWANDVTTTPDANNASDIFLRDIASGATTHISVNRLGTAAGNGGSDSAVLDFTGGTVAFSSLANDLVLSDFNNASDVFVRKVSAGQTTLISRNRLGTATANGPSYAASIDDAGNVIAFQSDATDLVFFDNNDATDVFVRQLSASTNALISVSYVGSGSAHGASIRPVISANGAAVVFQSLAEDLLPTDSNQAWDVYLRRLESPTNRLVSLNRERTASGFDASFNPVINTNGLVVAFDSDARNLTLIAPAVIPQVYAFTLPASGLGDFASALTIQAQAASIVLSWSTDLEGFQLQSRSVTDSGGWSAVIGTPVIRGGNYMLTNRPAGAQFYRLAKP